MNVSVSGADDDNIYINNQRVASGTEAKIALNQSEIKVVRIIVQNGENSPYTLT